MWEKIDSLLASAWRFFFGTSREFREHTSRLATINNRLSTIWLTNVFWTGGSVYRYRFTRHPSEPVQQARSSGSPPLKKSVRPLANHSAPPTQQRLVIRAPTVGSFLWPRHDGLAVRPNGVIQPGQAIGSILALGLEKPFIPATFWYDQGRGHKVRYIELPAAGGFFIAQVLVTDRQPIEWGQELFEITLIRRLKANPLVAPARLRHRLPDGLF